jgi:phosphorylcholine metabolism protein LicD
MKSDYHGLVEQSEINQSMDENFNILNLKKTQGPFNQFITHSDDKCYQWKEFTASAV